jgi:predicted RNase H-like HicB family nuclease
MKKVKFTFWKDEEFFIGYLNEYPEYETQGFTKEELIENLQDLLKDLESGEIPFVKKVEEFAID